MNKFNTTTGDRISEATIKRRYTAALRQKHAGRPDKKMCVCRGDNCQGQAVHNDHTIARARLKEIGKANLIYSLSQYAFVDSCAVCHKEFESYRDGACLSHVNYEERMDYMRIHDPEGAEIRENFTPMFATKK